MARPKKNVASVSYAGGSAPKPGFGMLRAVRGGGGSSITPAGRSKAQPSSPGKALARAKSSPSVPVAIAQGKSKATRKAARKLRGSGVKTQTLTVKGEAKTAKGSSDHGSRAALAPSAKKYRIKTMPKVTPENKKKINRVRNAASGLRGTKNNGVALSTTRGGNVKTSPTKFTPAQRLRAASLAQKTRAKLNKPARGKKPRSA